MTNSQGHDYSKLDLRDVVSFSLLFWFFLKLTWLIGMHTGQLPLVFEVIALGTVVLLCLAEGVTPSYDSEKSYEEVDGEFKPNQLDDASEDVELAKTPVDEDALEESHISPEEL